MLLGGLPSSYEMNSYFYSDAGGVDDVVVTELSFMNNTTKNVIHQKGMLIKKYNQKLRPLLFAIVAGHKAITIDRKMIERYHIVVIVYPNIVVANIMLLLCLVPL